MKRKYFIKALLAGCLALCYLSGFGENYITKQEINVRSGPATSYTVAGVIPADSIIDVQEINGNWATIQYNTQAAYISIKFISKMDGNNENTILPQKKKVMSTGTIIFYIVGGLAIILIIKFVTSRVSELLGLSGEEAFKYRCTNCGRYSTRRGHVYKCSDGAHHWFKL